MYDVLLVDPPWLYGSGGARGGEYAELDYPTLTLADLKALPVEQWCNANCAMFMWVTGSFMAEALEIGAAWGFKFIRVDKVWVKKTAKGGRHGVVGPWGMTDAEYLLLFVRGQMCSKQVQRNQFVVEVATYPGKHSQKPRIFRQMIEDRFPAEFKRLEMFSREKVPGWAVIGNDIDGRDIREVLANLPVANDNTPKAAANDNRPLTYGSVCSGIEAASVAWECLGWVPAWFAEIEPFPSAVLAHRWPAVANLGDMTKIAVMVANDNVPAPDVLVGGTPCQAFSVAGLRDGLADNRGQLTLEYVRLADAIDSKRTAAGFEPAIIVWENVPGVLSSKDNAFGCFLAGLAGESEPLVAPGGKWSNAGCVSGPSRTVAWRILDAQYFGVAQRRRRVFVVASARAGFDPAAVLFEFDGVRRDTAPSRESRTVVAALTANGVGTCGADDNQGQAGHLIPTKDFDENGLQRVVGTLCADTHPGAYSGQDAYTGRLVPTVSVVHGTQDPCVGNDLAFAIGRNNGGENVACYGFQPRIGRNGRGDMGELVSALTAQAGETGKGDAAPCVALLASGQESLTPWEQQGLRIQGDGGVAPTLMSNPAGGMKLEPIFAAMEVRRLTPTECERLQGFPDSHTRIMQSNGKPAADGPRYKALGNSMAVPVMRWIGQRIKGALCA